jgi:hypothetical protein
MRHADGPSIVQRDQREPLLLTLRDEHGNEMDSDTALSCEAAIKCAIMLLSRPRTPRPSSHGVAVPGNGVLPDEGRRLDAD